MSCKNGCLEITAKCCDDIFIQLGLDGGVDFTAQINQPGRNVLYLIKGTTEITGKIKLDKSKFPNGFFSYGYLRGELLDENNNIISFTVSGVEYDCFLIKLVDTIEL
jgi:hypothetical protein